MRPIRWSPEQVRKILVMKMRYIGDTVLVTPLIRALKQAMPEAAICLLTNREAAPVVKGHPAIDTLLAFDYERAKRDGWYLLRFLLHIRRQRFDLVIDLTRNDRSALFTFASGAPLRLGYEGGPAFYRLAYTHRVPYRFGSIHTVDHHLMMAKCLGLPALERHPDLTVPAEDIRWVRDRLGTAGIDVSRPYALIHPGARRWYKSWPADRFARIGDELIDRYQIHVVLSGGAGDEVTCRRIATDMVGTATNLCGEIPLSRLAALIHQAALLIGNDSAPIHIATAVKTPVIALFGPTRWEAWQPRRDRDITLSADLPCRPCGHGRPDCPLGDAYCLSRIEVERVLERIHDMMAKGPG
jgi:predicted lipopolysaccharide heptosyltransferase III